MMSQPPVAHVGRLRPQAVSRHSAVALGAHCRENRSSRATADREPRRETGARRHSRVHLPFCFALLRDSLSFARPNESKQRKRRPAQRRLTPVHFDAHPDGMRAELGSLSRSSNMLHAPAQCAGHPSPLRACVAAQREPIQTIRFELKRAAASWAAFGPLGRSAAQQRPQAEQGGRMFERSEFPAAPLAAFAGREPMRSIGARQGVFSLGYFSLDKQREVPRTAVRNPKPNLTNAVDSKLASLGLLPLRRSQVCRTHCFALQRDPLSFACPNESGQKKRHPGYASAQSAEPLRCASRRVWPELGSLWRSSNRLATSAQCADNPSAQCFLFAPYGAQYRQLAHSVESLRLHAGISTGAYVLVGLRLRLIRPTKDITLSERQRACLYSGPLGAAPSSTNRERNKTAGCLSVSEFPAVPLAIRDGREPMRSIGARQGVLCFGYFHLDKQMKVTRTAVRNPKPKFTRTVDSQTLSVKKPRRSAIAKHLKPATAAQCTGNASTLRFAFAPPESQSRHPAHSGESRRLHAGISTGAYVLVGLRPWLIRPTKDMTLSERPRRLPVFSPLGVAPSSGGRTRTKPAGCLSEASFRLARVRPEPRREPIRSIGARQGVLCFGYFHLDKQMKVTRAAARNPRRQSSTPVDSGRERFELLTADAVGSTPQRHLKRGRP